MTIGALQQRPSCARGSGNHDSVTTERRNLEWKTSWQDEYLKWICGFANAQGGVLEVGRDDGGTIVGVKDVLRLLEEIPNKVQSLLGIVVDVNLRSEEGVEYLQILVGSYPHPVSYKGEFHYRSGSTKQVLTGDALSRFLMCKLGRTWDDAPMAGVGVMDLDRRAIDAFHRLAAASGRLPRDVLDESDSEVVERLNLREGARLKRAALLLFHPAPDRFFREACVKVGYFRGAELLFQDVIEGDLFTQVDRTVDLLYTKYTRALVSYRGVHRVETFPVPAEAMREAVVNAVIHRDYTRPAPVQIRVYDDRIMLWNPGRLPEGWSLERLTGTHPSQPCNPVVANAFFRAGLIEAWGRGIQRIIEGCEAVGSPLPRWRIEPEGGLWVEFPFSTAYQAADARAILGEAKADEGSARTTQEQSSTTQENDCTTQELEQATQETEQTTQERAPKMAPTTRDRILALLKAKPSITRRLIAERIGITPDGVKYHLAKLRKAGIIRHVGPTKAGRWEVLKQHAARATSRAGNR